MKDREEYISILEQDNAELKKQVEEKDILIKQCELSVSNVMDCYCERTDCSGRIKDSKVYDSLVQKVETQQKEFIKYLEDESKEVYRDGGLRQNIFRQILQKYKEIIEEPKKIEKITVREKTLGFPNGEWTARNMDKAFAIKINELIDEIKNLKEK